MSPKTQKLPEPEEATIESLSHEGRGVTHINGKTVFVDNALPGETVRLNYLRTRSKRDEAEAVDILQASPQRIEPFCPYFHACGGCSLQHMEPRAQIEFKQQVLVEQLRHIGGVEAGVLLEPLMGPVRGYRHKARLGVKYVFKKQRLLVGFREKRSSFVADIDECGVLHPAVGNLLPALKELIAGLSIYNRIPQIEVAVGDGHPALVIRHLQPLNESDLYNMRMFEREHGVTLYLQAGGPDTVAPLTPGDVGNSMFYRFDEEDLTLSFGPLEFIQINLAMNRVLVKRILSLLEPGESDSILDMFCGLGNFTLPLSQYVYRVTGVEGDAELVERAVRNAELNSVKNADFCLADLYQEELQASFLRQDYNKVLLDPPRSGAREILQRLDTRNVEKILYVSCNPATLARDAGILVHDKGFTLEKAGVMDMFPHTAHVESIALFRKG
ncbi:MAG: 23S rRNA (uracil(1939)-C(5))-methyltransferase RlmD [Gammaproteobacteria bacterium]